MFSIADIVFGGTLRYMSRFKMLERFPRSPRTSSGFGRGPRSSEPTRSNMEVRKPTALNT